MEQHPRRGLASRPYWLRSACPPLRSSSFASPEYRSEFIFERSRQNPQ
jgi:hypothetical protein